MDKLSIVILNWNGKEMLESFLPTLIDNSFGDGISIIVADNSSTDGSVEMVKKQFSDVRLILLDRNYGFAEGYNRALKQVESEYFMLLNSDVEVTKEWLSPLLEYMDSHPETAACQPKLRDYKNREYFEYAGSAGGYMDKWGYLFCRGRIFDTVEKDNGQYDNVTEVFWATGAALMIRSSDYWNVGGLDDRFFAHQEEIDLCWRLRSRGRGIVCIPYSVVYHVGGATLNKSNPFKTFLNFRNNLLMLYKNLPESGLNKVLFVRFWLDMLAVTVFTLKLDFKDAGAVFRARREFRQIKHEFDDKRKANLEQVITETIPQRVNFSILWHYYAKRRRRFSELSIS